MNRWGPDPGGFRRPEGRGYPLPSGRNPGNGREFLLLSGPKKGDFTDWRAVQEIHDQWLIEDGGGFFDDGAQLAAFNPAGPHPASHTISFAPNPLQIVSNFPGIGVNQD